MYINIIFFEFLCFLETMKRSKQSIRSNHDKSSEEQSESSENESSYSSKTSVMENYTYTELKALKVTGFKLFCNINSGFFEWNIGDFKFQYPKDEQKDGKNIVSLRFLMKNKRKTPFLFLFELQAPITIEKLNFNCQWVLFDYFLRRWIQKHDFSNLFARFQVESALQRRNYIILPMNFKNEMTISDMDSLENFVDKICYILNNFHILIRKTTGFSWVYIGKIQNYTPKNLLVLHHLRQHQKERRLYRKELSIYSEYQILQKQSTGVKKLKRISSFDSNYLNPKEKDDSIESEDKLLVGANRNNNLSKQSLHSFLEAPPLLSARINSSELSQIPKILDETSKSKQSIIKMSSNQEIKEDVVQQKRTSSVFKKESIKPAEMPDFQYPVIVPKLLIKKLMTGDFGTKDRTNNNNGASEISRIVLNRATTTNFSRRRRKSSLRKTLIPGDIRDKKREECVVLEQNVSDHYENLPRQTLEWKELHLKGVKCEIFPDFQAIKHSFTDLYFYTFSDKYLNFILQGR